MIPADFNCWNTDLVNIKIWACLTWEQVVITAHQQLNSGPLGKTNYPGQRRSGHKEASKINRVNLEKRRSRETKISAHQIKIYNWLIYLSHLKCFENRIRTCSSVNLVAEQLRSKICQARCYLTVDLGPSHELLAVLLPPGLPGGQVAKVQSPLRRLMTQGVIIPKSNDSTLELTMALSAATRLNKFKSRAWRLLWSWARSHQPCIWLISEATLFSHCCTVAKAIFCAALGQSFNERM